MEKAFQRIYWENKPSTETPIDANNLNRIEAGVDTIDNRVVALDASQSGLSDRVTTAEGNITSLQNGKVDKVSGKDLSTNDYTNADKTKLAGISAQANQTTVTQVQESGDTSKEIAQIGLDSETTSIYADDAKKVIESCYGEKTVTGNPITVKTISGSNAKALKVTMNPIQDLHGYDHPWVGGAGKNMIDVNINTSVPSGQILFDTPITETVTISAKKNDVVISEAVWIIDILMSDNTHVYIGDTGYVNPFPQTINATPSKSIVKLTFRNYGITSGSYDIQMEYGSTATSFAPYSNICPISGRTEASMVRTGKNILYKTIEGVTIGTNGAISANSSYNIVIAQVFQGMTYTFSLNGVASVAVRSFFTAEPASGSSSYNGERYTTDNTFVSPITGYVAIRTSTNATNIQLENGSTATEYTPYVETETHTHQYGQTVYGGEDDFVNGGLTNTKKYIELDANSNWEVGEGAVWFFIGGDTDLPTGTIVDSRLCSNMFKNGYNQDNSIWVIYRQIHIRPSATIAPSGATAEGLAEFKNWLSTNNYKIQVCVDLATPTTIETSAENISLLKGNNVLSTDGDDMELTYQEIPDTTPLVNYVQTLEARIKALEEG